jgi:hypothetical protein
MLAYVKGTPEFMSSEKSAYAEYKAKKQIEIIAFEIEDVLFALTKKAADKAGQKHAVWGREILAQAVRAAGFEYEPRKATPATVAAIQAELDAAKAEIEQLRAAAAASAAAPTPPNLIADQATGEVRRKA